MRGTVSMNWIPKRQEKERQRETERERGGEREGKEDTETHRERQERKPFINKLHTHIHA